MNHRVLFAGLLVAAGLGFGTAAPARTRPELQAGVLDSVARTEARFFVRWDTAWKATQASIHIIDAPPTHSIVFRDKHVRFLHCHPGGTDDAVAAPPGIDRAVVSSRFAAVAVCPSWYVGRIDLPDERLAIDNALVMQFRDSIRLARDSVIAVLVHAKTVLPDNELVTGQLVRFLIDQEDWPRAANAARECHAAAWWCLTLQAYVIGRQGDLRRADSAYLVAVEAMPQGRRCNWIDVTPLLDQQGRDSMRPLDCAKRDSIGQLTWWLADPLYIVPGNDRRAEHFLRQTTLALHRALVRDERYDWRDTVGSDARAEMVLRYGWPAFTYWVGQREDGSHNHWLRSGDWPVSPPYTTFEYSPGRLHTVPAYRAVANPFGAAIDDWTIADTSTAGYAPAEKAWWPREHFPTPRLVQMREAQTVLLRRTGHAVLAVAVNLDPRVLERLATATIPRVVLVRSPAPDSTYVVVERRGTVGAPVAMWGDIPAQPAVVSVEVPPDGTRIPGARARFGIVPPEPLEMLHAGEVAISNPVVLQAFGDGEQLPVEPDAALARMAGSTVVQPVGRIGIYWETYGFAPTDTVELAVWIERHTPQGIFRRFTNKLQLTPDLNTPVAVSWTAVAGADHVYVIPGPVPVVARSVSVDVSALEKGRYWLDVAATSRGREPVRGRTEIVVR